MYSYTCICTVYKCTILSLSLSHRIVEGVYILRLIESDVPGSTEAENEKPTVLKATRSAVSAPTTPVSTTVKFVTDKPPLPSESLLLTCMHVHVLVCMAVLQFLRVLVYYIVVRAVNLELRQTSGSKSKHVFFAYACIFCLSCICFLQAPWSCLER